MAVSGLENKPKMEIGIQKFPHASYFPWRTPEEIPLKFNNKLCVFLLLFYFTYARMARMFIKNKMQLKWEKYLCVDFSMSAGPFKQTKVVNGASSRCLSL
jgi:hypothetical protein